MDTLDATNLPPDLSRPTTDQPQLASSPASNIMPEASPTVPQASLPEAPGDPDTCRICRAEGTADEPLFYPCKCSGSIKYVHQDCLMEWLSHSQKKHCELCKTPFRFTKLYSPDMPTRLPFNIFLSHMTRYLFRNLLVWLRAALVAIVWLGLLPWVMRYAWSSMFWLSDEGFGSSISLDARNASLVQDTGIVSLSVTGTTTCPSTPLLATPTTDASLQSIIDQVYVSTLLKAISKPTNTSSTQSYLRMLFGLSTVSGNSPQSSWNNTNSLNVTVVEKLDTAALQGSSLLSDVAVLKNFTRHPAINRTIISVLEGQVITLVVIVCFILIILVRDYVVQQQPEINMRAAFAAAENQQNEQPVPAEPIRAHHEPGLELATDDDDDDYEDVDSDSDTDSVAGSAGSAVSEGDPLAPRRDFPRFHVPRFPEDFGVRPYRPDDPRPDAGNDSSASDSPLSTPGSAAASRGNLPRAPPPSAAPSDDFHYHPSSVAFEEYRRFGEPDRPGDHGPRTLVQEYMRIYREAGGDKETILRMIRAQGDEERMAHLVRATQAVSSPGASAGGNAAANEPTADYRSGVTSGPPITAPRPLQENTADSDSSSWAWAELDDDGAARDRSSGKGKGKARPEDPEPGEAAEFLGAGPTRPRAVSDGPQRHDTISPFANNSWSFGQLASGSPSSPSAPTHSTSTGPNDCIPAPVHPPHSGPDESSSGPVLEAPFSQSPNRGPEGHHVAESPTGAGGGLAVPDQHDLREGQNLGVDAATDVPIVQGHADDIAAGAIRQPPPPETIAGRVAAFMFGNVGLVENEIDADLNDPAADQEVVAIDNAEEDETDDELEEEMAQDVVEAAVAAGLDPEAIEDAEDFEGIMELIGMRGPVLGLLQNAIFCAFLVAITIFLGIFIPYNIGRLAFWVLANPTSLVRMVFSFSKFVQDAVLLAVGHTLTIVFTLLEGVRMLLGLGPVKQTTRALLSGAKHIAASAWDRISSSLTSEAPRVPAGEVPGFSAITHESLVFLKGQVLYAAHLVGRTFNFVFGGDYAAKWMSSKALFATAIPAVVDVLLSIPGIIVRPSSWTISLDLPPASHVVDPGLAYWDAKDRSWAVLAGYISISVIAGLYLARGAPFSTSQTAQDWEASIMDALNQASGVMKVILIISIEMLVFPLYCGMLLDFALLPLFENTSLRSRLLFTYNYPLTSVFVHWFVGTGYMFHFALFVSMCRKIMRKGVLYFIRDPDDPEFHPVRDVLERNVTTQLRKILFSAFVYGALVVVCLGGVVWGLSLTLPNVLPIHYSSNEPVLEFPIDLLFYNFLMPLAVRFFKPSDGLHAMYTWWFRKCARALRLTWFLFGERRVSEEGQLCLSHASEYEHLPWWRRVFLEVNDESDVVPKTWRDTFDGAYAKPKPKIPADEMAVLSTRKRHLVQTGQMIPDGRFVRSPASDQVKMPKGQPVFLDVTDRDRRLDGKRDRPETDMYSSIHYQFVYIPPWFRVRIFLFILFIWIFAAVTGVSITIVPLVFGRRMFNVLIPAHIRTNDIYAFSIGIYILGSLGYFLFHLRSTLRKVRSWGSATASSLLDSGLRERAKQLSVRTLRLLYTYASLLIVFPLLITLLVELYLLMPLHTWMYPSGSHPTSRLDGLKDGHTIRVIQAWTLGILYLKLGSRALVVYGGRPAQAVRAVLRRGWFEPDIEVLTRAFVVPALVASAMMIFLPPLATRAFIHRLTGTGTPVTHTLEVLMYRLSYPMTALFFVTLYLAKRTMRIFDGLQIRIRDEAYLMGERLHNFGGTAAKVSGWKGGSRL
ncbi:hypothetical protein F4778DRAFT_734557 [Xylariomycetidae sp. FL2044]|nr:hypothetical protein F4778DRAFT_734557 [Xylariomycetidae sp. FL2044]